MWDACYDKAVLPNTTKWSTERWLIVVPHWPTVRHARLALPLTDKTFAPKDSTVVQLLAVQNSAQILLNYRGLVPHYSTIVFTDRQKWVKNLCHNQLLLCSSAGGSAMLRILQWIL